MSDSPADPPPMTLEQAHARARALGERQRRADQVIVQFVLAHSSEEIKNLVSDITATEITSLLIQHVMNQRAELDALTQTVQMILHHMQSPKILDASGKPV